MLRHAGIRVTDLVAARKFYEPLGFHTYAGSHETWDGVRLKTLKLLSKGGILELIETKGDWPAHHVALTVKDLYQTQFPVFGPGKEDEHVAVLYCQDPWGNWIELVQQKGEK
jgi:catechol 2,3-dioxygenase-like lactoylglutathione lyase family enzyme